MTRIEAVQLAANRDGGCVAVGLLDHTCGFGWTGHEPLLRKHGSDPTNPDHMVTLCGIAHTHVHSHVEWSRSVGLLVHAWETFSHERDWKDTR